jgi:hypothetical protein
LRELSDNNGFIHDVCEPNCEADGTQFKGIFLWSLAMLSNMVERDDPSFAEAIQRNVDSIWQRDRRDVEFSYAGTNLTDAGVVLSVNWAGPFVEPANASTHCSAMGVLVAALNVAKWRDSGLDGQSFGGR